MTNDSEQLELVGLNEISGILGVPPATVASWRQRGVLPKPRWQLSAGPVWTAAEIRAWYEHVKGTPAAADQPDRMREAIDLSAEPHRAEVFAHYGLAMGEAQMVEHHLATVITLLHDPPATQEMLYQIIERAEKRTLGALKDELRDFGVPVIGIDKLESVVATRNLLAHRFFRDPQRSVAMTTERGRETLITELDEYARQFWQVAQYLRAAEVRLAIQRGITKNDVMDRVRHHLKAGSDPATGIGRRARILATSPDVDAVVERAFVDAQHVPDILPTRRAGATNAKQRRSKGRRSHG